MKKHLFTSPAILIIGDFNPAEILTEFKIAVGDQMVLAGENIKIAEIRELIHWLSLKPLGNGKKMAIIFNAEKMTLEAANALLKTLEEPPSYAKIILTTLDEQKILPTIHSRCQKIRLLVNPAKEMDEYLSPTSLSPMNIKQRFDFAAKTAELAPDEIRHILTSWQIYFRQKLLRGEDHISVLTDIGRTKGLLDTNISVKLLLENLVLKF